MDQFFGVKSDDLIAPGPVIDYEYNGKAHKWITDFYYEPYNLVFESPEAQSFSLSSGVSPINKPHS